MNKIKQIFMIGVEWVSRLSQNSKEMKPLILVFILVLLGAFATTCRSESLLQFELGSTVERGNAPAMGVTIVWPNAGPKDADFQCGIEIVGSSVYRNHNPNQAAGQCLIVDGYKRFDIGLGVVYLQNIDDYNGSHTNFSLMAGYRITDTWGVIFRHWSNLGTMHPNIGRDMLLVTYRF